EYDIIDEVNLRIPHEQLHKREFALKTLNEIAPDVFHPVLQLTIKTLLERLNHE
ncbi:MAG: 2-amino-4-hydroxy-6-hydroxymethyldihydropteridine diphosphokinase, partial [Nitrospirae bacterium]|nr:2-amino-4-hydroxy-6-hydroxymethyldihydropteridine diphosphokinase [Nitrospirota bacterium]